jgi:hypothetical protein
MKVIPETYRVNYIGCQCLYCIVLSYVFMTGLICFLFNQLMYLIIDIPFSFLIQIILYTVQLNLVISKFTGLLQNFELSEIRLKGSKGLCKTANVFLFLVQQ